MPTQNAPRLSTSAIIFAIMITVGLCLTFASLGGALAMTYGTQVKILNSLMPVFIVVFLVAAISLIFFLASYIAGKISHQRLPFDSIVHGLATWAFLSLIFVALLCFATAAEGIRRNLGSISVDRVTLVTDVEIFKTRAVTNIVSSPVLKTRKGRESNERADRALILAWWICFFSLVLGFGTSIAGALLGSKSS